MEWDFVENVVPQTTVNYAEEVSNATEFTEVEARLAKAECYKSFLGDSLFGDVPTQIESEVEAEFREWAMGRLNTLMGLGASVQQLAEVFDEEGLEILANLVRTIKEKTALQNGIKRPGGTPQKPTTQPKPRKPGRLQKQAPAPAPQPRPVVQALPPKPVIQQPRPVPRPAPQTDSEAPQWITKIPADGQAVSKNGVKFVIRHVQMVGTDEFYENPKIGDFITQIPEGKAIKVPGINIVVWNNAGVYTKLIESPVDIKPNAAQHGGIPMPSAREMAGITLASASNALNMAPSRFSALINNEVKA